MEKIKKKLKDVSVLITNFNKLLYLKDCFPLIDELLQNGAEVIIVDDGSNDGSREILLRKNLTSDFILYLQDNLGSAAARNKCISLASRKYLQFLDMDDTIEVETLVESVSLMYKMNALNCIASCSVNGISQNFFDFKTKNSQDYPKSAMWLMQNKCYPRIIYSKDFVLNQNIKFMPTFSDLGGIPFILDDFFWLLHIASMNIFWENTIFINKVLYNYQISEQNSGGMTNIFSIQASQFLQASFQFLGSIKNCSHAHDMTVIHDILKSNIEFHVKYVSFPKYCLNLKSTFYNKDLFSDIYQNDNYYISLAIFIRNTLRRALINLLQTYIVKLRNLLKYEK